MFSRNQRVNKKMFIDALKGGKRFSTAFFGVTVKNDLDSSKRSRFSVAVSKKIFKKAVARNLYKRRVYHAIREMIKDKKAELPGGIYIFFPKSGVKDLDFKKMKVEISNILNLTSR